MLCGNATGIDGGNYYSDAAASGDLVAGRQRQAEIGHVVVGHLTLIALVLLVGCLFVIRQGTERQRHRLSLPAVDDLELDGRARRHRADLAGEFARIADRRIVQRGDDVTAGNAGFGRWTILLRLRYQRARCLLESQAVGDVGRHRLDLNTNPAARDGAFITQLRDHALHRVGWNCEGNTHRAARRREDRGIDADHVAIDVKSRAAGIAFVHRRIDLNEIVVGTRADVATAR